MLLETELPLRRCVVICCIQQPQDELQASHHAAPRSYDALHMEQASRYPPMPTITCSCSGRSQDEIGKDESTFCCPS
eukprot:4024975-Amphidinium_carterae.1